MMRRRKSTITPPSSKMLPKDLSIKNCIKEEEFNRKTIYKSKSLPSNLEQEEEHSQLSKDISSRLSTRGASFLTTFSRTRSVTFEPEILLITAVTDDDYSECKKILQSNKVDVNYRTASGQSIIHFAALAGSIDCIKLLIEYGADINVLDYDGKSVLDGAVRNGHFDCAVELINNGAMVEKLVQGGYHF